MDGQRRPRGVWTFRLSLLAFLSAVPLVLFGGSVTTLGAGMAVEGWWIAEGHFLLFFPVEDWFRDTGTFVEHSHRLCGIAVGLFAVAATLCAWRSSHSRGTKLAVTGALAAVCLQGTLGGLRVLENSPDLAFLHGALAQAVRALLASAVLLASPRFAPGRMLPTAAPRALGWFAFLAPVAVYAQIFFGAWYRHSLRPSPTAASSGLFVVHAVGALLVLVLIGGLAERLGSLEWSREAPAPLRRAGRLLGILLLVQVLLGGMAWAGFRPGSVGPLEWLFSVSHVLVGGLLLCQSTLVAIGVHRGGPRRLPDASLAGAEAQPEAAR